MEMPPTVLYEIKITSAKFIEVISPRDSVNELVVGLIMSNVNTND